MSGLRRSVELADLNLTLSVRSKLNDYIYQVNLISPHLRQVSAAEYLVTQPGTEEAECARVKQRPGNVARRAEVVEDDVRRRP